MKLSVITDEISQEFEHALDVMAEYGVRYAELRGLWGTNIGDLTDEQVSRARRALEARGMQAVCLSTPIFKCDLDEDRSAVRGPMHLATARGLAEQMDLLRRCAQIGREVGTNLIRVFSFWRQGPFTPRVEERIVLELGKAAEAAEEEDVLVLLENEHACYVGTGAEAARVLTQVDSPRVQAVWDPGNAFVAGETPYPDGFDAIRPFLEHVHVKDAVVKDDGYAWTVVGEGDIDYAGQFDALRRMDYRGFVSLETHYVPEGGTPEEGSRACLASLRRRFIED